MVHAVSLSLSRETIAYKAVLREIIMLVIDDIYEVITLYLTLAICSFL